MTPADVAACLGAEPSTTVLLFDFDGTLAPIVDDPAAAGPGDGVVGLLDALAGRFSRVAVVSGRPRAFLATWFGPAIDLSGLYGLETRIGGAEADTADASRWRPTVAAVAEDARARLPRAVTVEPKGLSLTVHYRRTPDAAAEIHRWADDAVRTSGLELRSAKASIELHPPIEVDKGTSVLALAGECRTAVYVGDDVGDLPAFAALDRLRAAGVTTVKIAVASDELPAAVADTADLVVDGPAGVVELFSALATPG